MADEAHETHETSENEEENDLSTLAAAGTLSSLDISSGKLEFLEQLESCKTGWEFNNLLKEFIEPVPKRRLIYNNVRKALNHRHLFNFADKERKGNVECCFPFNH